MWGLNPFLKSATLAESEGGLYSECPTRVTRRVVGLSPVGRTSSPITVLTRVDLPEPELPKKTYNRFFLKVRKQPFGLIERVKQSE